MQGLSPSNHGIHNCLPVNCDQIVCRRQVSQDLSSAWWFEMVSHCLPKVPGQWGEGLVNLSHLLTEHQPKPIATLIEKGGGIFNNHKVILILIHCLGTPLFVPWWSHFTRETLLRRVPRKNQRWEASSQLLDCNLVFYGWHILTPLGNGDLPIDRSQQSLFGQRVRLNGDQFLVFLTILPPVSFW